jgi:exodeoxyribonuclease V alpha subunit
VDQVHGKTTIIKALIDIYKANKYKVVLCAPTGRAAKRMSESTGEEAKTIHRLLDIGKIEDNKLENIDTDFAPIDADVIVIDEMSMVDIFLMNYITKAIYMGTKLVLVGDSNQLPSVGPGSVLKDIIESEKIPITNLDKIFRQAAQSKIILNAHQVNKGESFISKEEAENTNEDFFFIKQISSEKMLEQVISLTTGRLQKFGNYDFYQNMQILTPTKKGPLGTKELNKTLQANINPESESKKEKKFGDTTFREGDRVMQIKNNYDIFWDRTIDGIYENSTGVFNGEIGRIEKIDLSERQVKVVFDDEKNVWYQFSELDQLELAYSITIHKSQGSEFDVVIIVAPQAAPMLLTRNLLYTAITRAKKLLVIVGSKNTIDFMIQNVDSKKRNTGLKSKISDLLKEIN